MKNKPLSPRVFYIFIILSIGLHFLLPIKQIIFLPFSFFGIIVILFAFILNIWGIKTLQSQHTTIEFYDPSTNLATSGPYRFSRNPVYLSGVILLFGLSILLGSVITFVFPIALILILDRVYIPLEEKKLKKAFGEDYLHFRQNVRRWI